MFINSVPSVVNINISLVSCLIEYSFAMVSIVAMFSVRYTLRQKQQLSTVVHGYHGYHLCYP